MNKPILSICIPSYNRPIELDRLLRSIDYTGDDIEIVICEDCSPKRQEICHVVEAFSKDTCYKILYHENIQNCGYDKNLRECIIHASGKWVMYMGDDDMFVPQMLDPYILFLKNHPELGYVLRSYQSIHSNGSIEKFKYFPDTCFFGPGLDTCAILFRKSLFISGFCFQREYGMRDLTDALDGSLLYQLYILSEVCMKYPSAYFGEPITQSIDGGIPYFGSSETEKGIYTPGSITVENSVAFMKKYFVVTRYLDQKHHMNLTERVRKDLAKYSYPILSIQREKGRKVFWKYHKELCKIGINDSVYYYIYLFALYVCGKNVCDNGIRAIKKCIGRTPQL